MNDETTTIRRQSSSSRLRKADRTPARKKPLRAGVEILAHFWIIVRNLVGEKKNGNPIVPERSVSSQTLVIVVAIMSFLTCLTFAMVTIVWEQTARWQSDIVQEVTIQVRPVDGTDFAQEIVKAIRLAETTPGVERVASVDDEWSKQLLEPWLGKDFDLSDLPVPHMLILKLDPSRTAHLDELASQLNAQVKGASLDNRRLWLDRLSAMANSALFVGFVLMGLMLTAMTLSVTFATHGAMISNQDVLDVLHFVGGRDSFIAAEFQRRFLLLGLKGAMIGGGTAIFCFFLLSLWARLNEASAQADQLAALFGQFRIGVAFYLGSLVLMVLIGFLTALTSRLAVFRYLTKVN